MENLKNQDISIFGALWILGFKIFSPRLALWNNHKTIYDGSPHWILTLYSHQTMVGIKQVFDGSSSKGIGNVYG
jgi:hypothetical protein